ncbi:MAG: hypothetical protein CL606_01780 [Anaerolineaceae bacterium]|nr:hypothetical protein [Anaerolineaceae bacterium]
MSDLRASNFRGRTSGSVPDFPDGATVVSGISTLDSQGVRVAGVITATSFVGSGANLTDVISGIGVTGGESGGSVTANLGTGLTAINFSGATATYHEATGISTVTIAGWSQEDTWLFGS